MFACGLLYMDEQMLDDQLETIYSSSVPIQDIAWKICWDEWQERAWEICASNRTMIMMIYVVPSISVGIEHEMIRRVMDNFRERLRLCVDNNGKHLIDVIFKTK